MAEAMKRMIRIVEAMWSTVKESAELMQRTVKARAKIVVALR
jgi:hypothetical protein